MAFMQKDITPKQTWYQVDTCEGIMNYPADLFSKAQVAEMHDIEADLIDEDIDLIEGFGARMSAPGYMDCTEWSVFDTVEQADEYLDEYFGDDE